MLRCIVCAPEFGISRCSSDTFAPMTHRTHALFISDERYFALIPYDSLSEASEGTPCSSRVDISQKDYAVLGKVCGLSSLSLCKDFVSGCTPVSV